MKSIIKRILQKILGLERYLYIFSVFMVYKLPWDKNEGDFTRFTKLIPQKEGLIIDIGANIGIMTCYFAKNFKHNHIIAIEPLPDNIKAMKKAINYFNCKNKVTIKEIAVGNETKNIEMVMPVIKSVKMQGLSHVVDSDNNNNEGIKHIVPCKRIDDLPDIQNKSVIAIKIDVENYEYFALKGAKELLNKNKPPIYCELWENKNRTQTFELLTSIGYKIFCFENKKLKPYTKSNKNTQNFVFLYLNK